MNPNEIIQKISALLEEVKPVPEDAEKQAGEEELLAQLNALPLEREELLENLAALVLDTRDRIRYVKTVENRMKEQRRGMTRKRERLMTVLDRECEGKKTDLGVATLFYRTNYRTEITDEEAAFAWLKENGHEECYRIPKPELSKTAIGRLLEAGKAVPGAERVACSSCYLK